jgi:hypothetical protein
MILLFTDERQFNRSVPEINIRGNLILSSATDLDNGPARNKSKSDIKPPKSKLSVNALLTKRLVKSFCCTIADPIPVSEKLANTVAIAVIAA